MGVDDATWTLVSELEKEFDTKPFFKAVRSFYIATLNKMFNKFPFGDTVLHDMGIINPENTSTYDFITVARFAKQFHLLGINDSESIDALRSEFVDFKLSINELATVETYKSAAGFKLTSQDLDNFGMTLSRCNHIKIFITGQADDEFNNCPII